MGEAPPAWSEAMGVAPPAGSETAAGSILQRRLLLLLSTKALLMLPALLTPRALLAFAADSVASRGVFSLKAWLLGAYIQRIDYGVECPGSTSYNTYLDRAPGFGTSTKTRTRVANSCTRTAYTWQDSLYNPNRVKPGMRLRGFDSASGQ